MNAELMQIGEQKSVDLRDCVQLGKLVGVWGVKGWLKVFSYTRPRNNIGQYKQWLLVAPASKNRNKTISQKHQLTQATIVDIKNCKAQGQNVVACIDGVNFRDQAESLFGLEIYIEKSQLKPLKKGEFYWSDMIGCEVVNTQDEELGEVTSIMETGANDVLVVGQKTESGLLEHLIPYSDEIILSVDAENKIIQVDWGADYLAQERDTTPRKKKQTKQELSEEIRLQKLAAKNSTEGEE